jgi:hypothetical protein
MGFFTKLLLGTGVYIGCLVSFNRYYAPSKVPDSPPVPAGKTRICVAVRHIFCVVYPSNNAFEFNLFNVSQNYVVCARGLVRVLQGCNVCGDSASAHAIADVIAYRNASTYETWYNTTL